MTINKAKRRMLQGHLAIGAPIGLGSPLVGEMLSPLGFDFILVDCQHGIWDDQSTMHAFRSISLGSAVPMARAPRNDFGAIGRLLDMGALGVVVPMVNSAIEAEEAAFAARYPPNGGRSIGAFGAGYHGSDYAEWIDDEMFLAVQIETAEGLENVEEIMAVEGVDGCWIGPGDLRLAMGIDVGSPQGRESHTHAMRTIFEACRKTNKIPGIGADDATQAKFWVDEGGLFVTVGWEDEWIIKSALESLKQLGRPV